MIKLHFQYRVSALCTVLVGALMLAGLTGCEKFLDIKPAGVVMPSSTADYRALLTRAYQGLPADLAKLSMRSDEASVNFDGANASYRPSYEEIYLWRDGGSLSTLTTQWQGYYYSIYVTNHLIDILAGKEGASADEKQLVGEAYLLRAYSYFLLANIYGQPYAEANLGTPCVPLMLDNEVETVRERSSLGEVYAQVVKDLTASFKYLQEESWESAKRYRFSKDAAHAFACRVALYMGEWAKAVEFGAPLLSSRYQLVDLNATGAKPPCHYESTEAIMNLDLVVDGDYLSIMRPSQSLIDSYGAGDQRKRVYYRMPALGDYRVERGDEKKGEGTAYRITFRLGEVLLNVAEAHAREGELEESKALLKQLAQKRYEAGELPNAEAAIDALTTQSDLLKHILAERGRELAFEGLRWFDLRRFGCPEIVHTLDGQEYRLEANDARYTLPIPREAKESNSNL